MTEQLPTGLVGRKVWIFLGPDEILEGRVTDVVATRLGLMVHLDGDNDRAWSIFEVIPLLEEPQ